MKAKSSFSSILVSLIAILTLLAFTGCSNLQGSILKSRSTPKLGGQEVGELKTDLGGQEIGDLESNLGGQDIGD